MRSPGETIPASRDTSPNEILSVKQQNNKMDTQSRSPYRFKTLSYEMEMERLKSALMAKEKANTALKSAILATLENVAFIGEAKYSKALFNLIK
jgi:hypothetical protein